VSFESPECRAKEMGISIIADDLPTKIRGYASPFGSQWCIVVSRELSPQGPEREWTVAHELTHIVCRDPAENLADAGAAEVLFPRRSRELQDAVAALGKLDDVGTAIGTVVTALSSLMALEPYLIDDQKKRYVCTQGIALVIVAGVGLVALGLVKLFEYLDRRRALRRT